MNTRNLKFKFLIALIFVGLKISAVDIWVSPNGSDSNSGTSNVPMATLSQALLKARGLRLSNDSSIIGGIHIILKGGTYQLSETVVLSSDDAGTAASPTFIEAAPGEIPVISGGIPVTGWQDAGVVKGLPKIARNKTWVANTPKIGGFNINFRQLWVNNAKVYRASTLHDASVYRLIAADKTNQNILIPTPKMSIKSAKNMELTIIQEWEVANLRIKSIDSLGLSTRLTFKQPESGLEFKRPWPPLVADNGGSNNQFFYLSNALELLDKPWEWYNDSTAGKIYYWPRAGEDKANIKVVAPVLETLIKIEGTLNSTVSYIKFKGINFEHTTWMRPSYAGHVPLQGGQYILDAYSDASAPGGNVAWVGRPSAGVSVKGASHINFEGCTFQHMASTGLDFVSGTHNDSVQGCIFTDIGGNGILIGYFGDKNFEAHKAYNPTDNREVCQFEVIKNNYITNISTEDWGCIGVNAGFASDVIIKHNEICNVNYAAISVGWGWIEAANCMKNNVITANYIHDFANNMQDVGGIYTLSTQVNSAISNNRIEKKGDPIYNTRRWAFFIYMDEGTDYYKVVNNWTEYSSIITNKNGTHNIFGTNGPEVSNTVKIAAGLESGYKDLVLRVHTPTGPPIDSIIPHPSDISQRFVCRIRPLNSNLYLDGENGNLTFGAKDSLTLNQVWAIEKIDSVKYKIVSQSSSKCITVKDSALSANAEIIQSDYNGKGNQKWSIYDYGHGVNKLTASHSNQCMEFNPNGTIVQNSDLDISSQRWILEDTTVVKTAKIAIETFDYPLNKAFNNLGTAREGWGGPWKVFEGVAADMSIVAKNQYSGLNCIGNRLNGNLSKNAGTRANRELNPVWKDDGDSIWISFLLEVTNPTSDNNSWQGVSLFYGSSEQVFMGKNWGVDKLGFITSSISGNNIYSSNISYKAGQAWIVMLIKTSGDDSNEQAYMWINPSPKTHPNLSKADISQQVQLNNGFDHIVCHLGQTAGIKCFYDEFKLGRTFTSVASPFATEIPNINRDEIGCLVYPNPASEQINISLNSSTRGNATIQVLDLTGKELFSNTENVEQGENHFSLNTKNILLPGIYFVSLQTEKDRFVKKIIIKK